MDILVIGIAGGTGSGKTTLVARLKERFGDDICVLSHSSYYKPHRNLSLEERRRLNYDHPEAFDTKQMISDLEALRRGEMIACPIYDFSVYDRSKESILLNPAKVIIVEGILVFENPALRELMDIKVFVDTDADVRLIRRIAQHVGEQGKELKDVVEQYLTTVKPMHEQFVEPSKRYADVIVPEGGNNIVALDMLMQRIVTHIFGEE